MLMKWPCVIVPCMLAAIATSSVSWSQPASDSSITERPLDDGDGYVEQLRRAIDAGNLLPPDPNNAMALAMAKSKQLPVPGDLSIWQTVRQIVAIEKSHAVVLLNKGLPADSWQLANRLHSALIDYSEEHESHWLMTFLSDVERWRQEIQPSLTEALIDDAEEAIDRHLISSAPDGERSAADYLDILVSLLGSEHDDVLRLGDYGTSVYRWLIDQATTKERYLEALSYVDRMEAFAAKFASSPATSLDLRKSLEVRQAKFEEYQDFLQFAEHLREEGHLIRPRGANALEFVVKAMLSDVRPLETRQILLNVIWSVRGQIGNVIKAGRLNDAIGQLEDLSDALDGVSANDISRLSKQFSNEAQDLRQQVSERERRLAVELERLRGLEEERAADEKAKGSAPVTFVSPF